MKYFLYSLFFVLIITVECLMAWVLYLIYTNSHPYAFHVGGAVSATVILLNAELIRAAGKLIKSY